MNDYSTDPFEKRTPSDKDDAVENEPVFSYDDEGDSTRTACITIAVIFAILVAAGVGVWYYISHKAPATNVTDVDMKPDTTTGNTTAKNMISAKDGGEVIYKDPYGKTVKISIPAGALEKDTKISVAWVASGRVTDEYHLMPDGLTFKKPITVTIPYKESGLAKNETPQDIQLEYWFKNMYGSRTLLKFSIDSVAKTLSAAVDKF